MNFAIAVVLVLLLALLTLVSYVDRVYSEIGKFLSREFQDNIDAFEHDIEPRLGVGRMRASLSMAVLTQMTTAAIAMVVGFEVFRSRMRCSDMDDAAVDAAVGIDAFDPGFLAFDELAEAPAEDVMLGQAGKFGIGRCDGLEHVVVDLRLFGFLGARLRHPAPGFKQGANLRPRI